MLGVSHMHVGQLDLCYKILEKSIAANPNHYSSHLNFATAVLVGFGKGGNVQLGLERAETAIKLRPEASNAQLVKGRLAVTLKQYDEAISAFEKAYSLDARNPDSAILAAVTEVQAGRKPQAIDRLTQLVEAFPESARIKLVLASVHIESNQLDKARELVQAAMSAKVISPQERQQAEQLRMKLQQLMPSEP